jgi:hypothetical protein
MGFLFQWRFSTPLAEGETHKNAIKEEVKGLKKKALTYLTYLLGTWCLVAVAIYRVPAVLYVAFVSLLFLLQRPSTKEHLMEYGVVLDRATRTGFMPYALSRGIQPPLLWPGMA